MSLFRFVACSSVQFQISGKGCNTRLHESSVFLVTGGDWLSRTNLPLHPDLRINRTNRSHIQAMCTHLFLESLLVVFHSKAQQARPQTHLSLRPAAPVLTSPPHPPLAAAVGPVQLNRSSVYTTAQREPRPAPSNWTSLMSGESGITPGVGKVEGTPLSTGRFFSHLFQLFSVTSYICQPGFTFLLCEHLLSLCEVQ